MSDQLIAPAPPAPSAPAGGWLRAALIQAGVIVVVFALVGALAGVLWEAVWSPARGEVVDHTWYPYSWDLAQPAQFAGTGWYVVIAVVAGLVLGGLAAWRLDRAELVTLAAVVLGSLLGAYLMRVVGLHQSPGDPQKIAKTAADGTKLPSQLQLASWWLLLAFPAGALTSLAVVFLTVSKPAVGGTVQPAQDG